MKRINLWLITGFTLLGVGLLVLFFCTLREPVPVSHEKIIADTTQESEPDSGRQVQELQNSISQEESSRESKADPDMESVSDGPVSPVLMFAGDVLLSDHVTNAYDRAGGIWGIVSESLLNRIQSSDIFMVNQEFPFSSQGEAAADKQYTFRLDPRRVHMLNEMGISIVTLANNHALDFGRNAMLDTVQTLEEEGILHVGAGENLEKAKQSQIMEVGGKKIGFLAASRVIPETGWNADSHTPGMLTTYDPKILLEEIEKAKAFCDYIVVYVHWGIERDERPQEYQRALGKKYIDAGADLVIGSHPHVLQGIEYYNGKPIVYSLGNFVFGSSILRTMLLEAELGADGIRLSLIPGTASGGYTSEITDAAEIEEFYRYMESISYGVRIDEGVVLSEQAQP